MSIAPPESSITPERLVARAEEMIPALRERQEECESLGRMPDATSEELIDAGFYRILQPRASAIATRLNVGRSSS